MAKNASDQFRAAMSQVVDASEGMDAARESFQINEDAHNRPVEPVKVEVAEPAEAAAPETEVEEEEAAAAPETEEAAPEAEQSTEAAEVGAEEEATAETGDLVELEDGSRVPVADLIKGQLREADYTRKTQELAGQRREMENAKQTLAAQAGEASQRLQTMAQELEQAMTRYRPSPQQMAELRRRDPVEWAARNEEDRQQQELLQAANAEGERIRLEQQAIIIPQQRQALAAKVPAFEKDFKAEYEQLGGYATSSEGGGLSREEWDQLVDHRHVTLVWKAQQYDKAARSAPRLPKKLPRNTPKVLRPGVQQDARDTKSEGYAAALARQRDQGGDARSTADAFAAREQLRRKR